MTKSKNAQRLICAAAALVAMGITGGNIARGDVTLGQDWLDNGSGGWDSFHNYNTADVQTVVNRGGSDWLRIDLSQQYYSGFSADTVVNLTNYPASEQYTMETIASNPYLSFEIDLTEYTWPAGNFSIAIAFWSDDNISGPGFSGETLVASAPSLVGAVTTQTIDLTNIIANPVEGGPRPDTDNFNIGINVRPGWAPGTYTTQHYFIDNVKLTATPPAPPPTPGSGQWIVNGNGNWYLGANWSPNVPSAINNVATFGTNGGAITVGPVVTVDGARTVGAMVFENPNGYTLNNAGITLDVTDDGNPDTNDAAATIDVFSGTNTINSPVIVTNDEALITVSGGHLAMNSVQFLLNNATFSVASGSSVTVNNLDGGYYEYFKTGAGSLTINRVPHNTLVASEGLVKIAAQPAPNTPAGTSQVYTLSIGASAVVDLTNNSMVVDYPAGTGPNATLEDEIRQHLESGRLTSSSAGGGMKLGYGDNAVLNQGSFGGLTVDTDTILIKFTYAGDANLDGQVTISDLGDLASNWQSTTAMWRNGDFNYDGAVTISDLGDLASNWQAGVGSPLGMSFQEALAAVGFDGAAVPEPASMGLLSVGLVGLVSRRRRM